MDLLQKWWKNGCSQLGKNPMISGAKGVLGTNSVVKSKLGPKKIEIGPRYPGILKKLEKLKNLEKIDFFSKQSFIKKNHYA